MCVPSDPQMPTPARVWAAARLQVREAQLAQYNYILVVGEEEKAAGTVNVRTRDNQVRCFGGLFPKSGLLEGRVPVNCCAQAGELGRGRRREQGVSKAKHATRLAQARCTSHFIRACECQFVIACLQVHGQHPLDHVIEVMSRERKTRSRVGLFGEHNGEAGAAADGSAEAAH